jgi:hypothetical protein
MFTRQHEVPPSALSFNSPLLKALVMAAALSAVGASFAQAGGRGGMSGDLGNRAGASLSTGGTGGGPVHANGGASGGMPGK